MVDAPVTGERLRVKQKQGGKTLVKEVWKVKFGIKRGGRIEQDKVEDRYS